MLFALCVSQEGLQIGYRFAEIRKKFGVRRSELGEKKKKKEKRRIMRDREME